MHALYLASVWLHILAAIVWIGGMSFLVLVVVPWLRQGRAKEGGAFLRETGERFRAVGWVCFGVVLATGAFNLWFRSGQGAALLDGAWWSAPFGRLALGKLLVFGAVVAVSAWHDFGIGPQAAREIERDPSSARAAALRRRASVVGRANLLLALVLVALAVMLVRGVPW